MGGLWRLASSRLLELKAALAGYKCVRLPAEPPAPGLAFSGGLPLHSSTRSKQRCLRQPPAAGQRSPALLLNLNGWSRELGASARGGPFLNVRCLTHSLCQRGH